MVVGGGGIFGKEVGEVREGAFFNCGGFLEGVFGRGGEYFEGFVLF